MDLRKLRLLLAGLAAGDSLGSTSEFQSQSDVVKTYERLKGVGWPFVQAGGGSFGWTPGEATDDTDMALCILRSVVGSGRFDGAAVAKQFVDWLDSSPPDVGNATRNGLSAVRGGTPWYEGGLGEYQRNQNSAANGSLMRNGVVAALAESVSEGWRMSLLQSLPTHYGPLPVICCCAQTYLLRELLAGRNPFATDWLATFREQFCRWLSSSADEWVVGWRKRVGSHCDTAMEAFGKADFDPDSFTPFRDFAGADGYCLLTLQIAVWAAIWSQRQQPFPTPNGYPAEVFLNSTGPLFLCAVAMIGRDSDTYGAVAGPLIAAAHGGVPKALTDGLEALQAMKRLGL